MKKVSQKITPPKLQLFFQVDLEAAVELPSRYYFRRWVMAALMASGKTFKKPLQCTLRIVEAAESRSLNATYRQKDAPTNVLSFPFPPLPAVNYHYLGDLVICASKVIQEASEQHKSALAHWAHLTIHGTLHLLGYDHVQTREAEAMETLEIDILRSVGFENPY
ncbi:MAG: rRNA maturation RNase YbeY [Gammaproteobacteria bacterium]